MLSAEWKWQPVLRSSEHRSAFRNHRSPTGDLGSRHYQPPDSRGHAVCV